MKTNGFNIKNTHLSDIEWIEKLLALVIVAFTGAYVVGDCLNQYIKPIKIKNRKKKPEVFSNMD